MPLLLPSVASVTARLRRVVTWDKAPSAVCSKPTPLLAFCCDCVKAAIFAFIPLAIDIPAESSEPELIFKPVESCVRVFCRFIWVLDNAFSAVRSETLFRIEIGMGSCSFYLPMSACTRLFCWARIGAQVRREIGRAHV